MTYSPQKQGEYCFYSPQTLEFRNHLSTLALTVYIRNKYIKNVLKFKKITFFLLGY